MCDDTMMYPSTEKEFFPEISNSRYWTSTTEGNHLTRAWFLEYGPGITSYNEKTGELLVRCVRGGLIAK